MVVGQRDTFPMNGVSGNKKRQHMEIGVLDHVLSQSLKVSLDQTKAEEGIIKPRSGLGGTMTWALRELEMHQEKER